MTLLNIFIAYLALINLTGVVLMGWDKYQARRGGWRVPERTLMGAAAVGGSLGVLAGMRLFRHKTQHWLFRVGVPLLLIAHLTALYLIYR